MVHYELLYGWICKAGFPTDAFRKTGGFERCLMIIKLFIKAEKANS